MTRGCEPLRLTSHGTPERKNGFCFGGGELCSHDLSHFAQQAAPLCKPRSPLHPGWAGQEQSNVASSNQAYGIWVPLKPVALRVPVTPYNNVQVTFVGYNQALPGSAAIADKQCKPQ